MDWILWTKDHIETLNNKIFEQDNDTDIAITPNIQTAKIAIRTKWDDQILKVTVFVFLILFLSSF